MFHFFVRSAVALLALCSLSLAASATVILNVDSETHKLTGASGVTIDGKNYSVKFMDGTCSDLFNGCDTPDDSPFTTRALVDLASQALRDTVFINAFDESPFLTQGCSEMANCFVLTHFVPFLGYVGDATGSYFHNGRDGHSFDYIGSFSTSRSHDLSKEINGTWAVWTAEEIATVSEPSVLSLFALSAVALIWSRRRRVGSRVH